MSLNSLFSGIGMAALGALDTILLRAGRNIAGIIPDCTIEERHKDELEITQSPVEQGAPIADHAFKKPAELLMRVAWSDSRSIPNLITAAQGGTLSITVKDIYQQLLTLQYPSDPTLLQPFSIVTGKRTYDDMLLKSLQVITNHDSENSLMVEALFQQVIIVSTQVATASSLGLVENQAQPQNTAAPTNTGAQQLGQNNTAAAAAIAASNPPQ